MRLALAVQFVTEGEDGVVYKVTVFNEVSNAIVDGADICKNFLMPVMKFTKKQFLITVNFVIYIPYYMI